MQVQTKTKSLHQGTVRTSYVKPLLIVGQLLAYPGLILLRMVIVRNNITIHPGSGQIQKRGARYVIYANHQSILDPFVICPSLPLGAIGNLLPFRSFVENSYFHGPAKIFLNLAGGFPAHYHPKRSYGLEKAKSLLHSGQTVVIFPPGTRTRKQIAKPGVSKLASEPNTYLIPVYIDWKSRWSCHVHIGKPNQYDSEVSAQELMQHVYNLAD